MKELTISELIDILTAVREQAGELPIVALDNDTDWQMPLVAVARTADDYLLLQAAGYSDDAEVRPHPRPVTAVWVLPGYEDWFPVIG